MQTSRNRNKPVIQNHTAVNFGAVKAANALYIGPRQFEDELQPLIELRRSQGFKPLFVDIQSIFDVYGYGHVSASGLRNFLRDQTDWQNPTYQKPNRRIAVTLAGDGTYDPHNYEGKDVAEKIFPIPAYMADVDSYILEAACEPCFAQLNGDDPLTGDGDLFAADIWLGRLPARNEGEISALVNKIVAYETRGSDSEAWRRRTLLLADNYIKSINEDKQAIRDDAGDFPIFSDQVSRCSRWGVGSIASTTIRFPIGVS